jgi:outer membrane protein TolC
MSRSWRRLAVTLLAVSGVGCVVGPNYHPPSEDVPARWSEAPPAPAVPPRPLTQWWKSFSDPELDSLVDRALRANLNVQLAEALLHEARARRQIAAAPLWPSLDATGSYTRQWLD